VFEAWETIEGKKTETSNNNAKCHFKGFGAFVAGQNFYLVGFCVDSIEKGHNCSTMYHLLKLFSKLNHFLEQGF
jgi:hypothetical protein